MPNNTIKGYTLGIIGSAFYGLNPLFTLPLYQKGMEPSSVLFYRYFFAIILLAMLLKSRGMSFKLKKNEVLPLFAMGILFSLSSYTLYLSYNYMDAGVASTILFLYPIMVAVINMLVFHERMGTLTALSIALAFYGISMLYDTASGQPMSMTGLLLVVASALSYAIYLVAINRSTFKTMPTEKLTFYSIFFGISVYLVSLHGLADLQPLADLSAWTNAISLALFPTVISLVFISYSIHYIGSTPTSILGALEPVTALVCGVLIFGEVLTPKNITGIMFVLLSVTLIVVAKQLTAHLQLGRLIKVKIRRR